MQFPVRLAAGPVAGVVLFAAACEMPSLGTREVQTVTREVELDGAESVDVELRMSAGELTVRGGAAKLVEAGFRFNVPEWEPVVDYRAGERASLRIAQPDRSISLGRTENTWELRLNDTIPLSLELHLGAGRATLDLRTLPLSDLVIHQGVGELDLDLRGTPRGSYAVRVNGGVGSARIRVPPSVGIVATATGGIGSSEVRGLERRGDTWHNPGHEDDAVQIRLDVKGGIGEIEISADPVM